MKVTRLGISAGLLGAAIYFMGLFGGYIVTILLVGYVLLFEENPWLKRSAVKAAALMILFSLLSAAIALIPNFISLLDDLAGIFGGGVRINAITSLVGAVSGILEITRKILFAALGFLALNQGTIRVPIVDGLLDQYM